MIRCYLGLGANLQDPSAQLVQAIASLQKLPQSNLIEVSDFYATKPIGPQDQPDYVNAVACIDTSLSPLDFLDALQSIENTQGRVRKEHWGARTLDIDILLYGDQVINTERLIVPHAFMHERAFVLYPLSSIAPSLALPNGQSMVTLLAQVPNDGIVPLCSAPSI
jgi:2-amino-4-hydroxy-6-hydroxymethyldihydropteridine diphosphokinase